MKVQHTEDEPIYFDHYDPEALYNIIHTKQTIIEYQKKQNHKKLFSVLIIVDDLRMIENLAATQKYSMLYIQEVIIIVSLRLLLLKFSSIAPIIRVNATELYVYRLGN